MGHHGGAAITAVETADELAAASLEEHYQQRVIIRIYSLHHRSVQMRVTHWDRLQVNPHYESLKKIKNLPFFLFFLFWRTRVSLFSYRTGVGNNDGLDDDVIVGVNEAAFGSSD